MKLIILLSFLLIQSALAIETCSRTAYVNYQKVIIDSSTSNKGEGLRYYLAKDEKALELLNTYQLKNKPSTTSTFFSSLGGSMVLAGLVYSSFSTNRNTSNSLLFGGLAVVGLNFFYTRIKQYQSEPYLEQSIKEYNKRNTPKIFFSPTMSPDKVGIGVGAVQEF